MATNSDPGTRSYLLDSSVATLILNGKLWEREPYTPTGTPQGVADPVRADESLLGRTQSAVNNA